MINKDLAKKITIALFLGACSTVSLYYFKKYFLAFLSAVEKELPVVEYVTFDFFLVGIGLFCISILMLGTYETILKKPPNTLFHKTLLYFLVGSFVFALSEPIIARYSVDYFLSKKGNSLCLDEKVYLVGGVPTYYYSKDQSLCESGQFDE